MRKKRATIDLDARAIGARIRALRKAKSRGWTMAELSRRADIYYSTLSHIELGLRAPTLVQAVALAVVLRRSMEFVCFGLPRNGKLWNLINRE